MSKRYLIFLACLASFGFGYCAYMTGKIVGTLSVVDTISATAEEHKQRFYEEGYNDALDHISLANLECNINSEPKTFGELADMCRERHGIKGEIK